MYQNPYSNKIPLPLIATFDKPNAASGKSKIALMIMLGPLLGLVFVILLPVLGWAGFLCILTDLARPRFTALLAAIKQRFHRKTPHIFS
jgi:hypothetical protein